MNLNNRFEGKQLKIKLFSALKINRENRSNPKITQYINIIVVLYKFQKNFDSLKGNDLFNESRAYQLAQSQ